MKGDDLFATDLTNRDNDLVVGDDIELGEIGKEGEEEGVEEGYALVKASGSNGGGEGV